MKAVVNTKKKIVTIKASGKEKGLFTLITAFAGDSVIYPKKNKSTLEKLSSIFVDKIVIDLQHPSVSKEFVQLLLRMK